ncbi:MAG: histone deacetylase family protein, partial [Deltaproteobacteria bacterium]|nr:histone deacetylase family protein [Deltaproteobacteria bacterium]
MKVVFHDDFYQVYTSDPAASAGRMEAVVEVIRSRTEFVEAKPASEGQIALAHVSSQIESVR